ncbi:hypothetical protein V5F77_02725 [Xanthobacter sp. DSM 24535]|uniref:hypothetical protein n=1 Tax=Roseixanthobacter psychrophilus TaxID=3119917 RepID=UPI00372B3468
MSEKAFFLVWNPEGRTPHYRHPSQASALAEAKRLAALNPGQKFYVLQPLAIAATRDPVEIVHLVVEVAGDGIPF